MYKRLCRRRFGVIGLALATAVLTVELPSASADSVVTVSVDPSTVTGHISDLLFGANHRYGLNGSGASDPSTGLTYPSVEDAIKQTHLSMIRYPGGTAANTFHFVRAIGPQDKRTNQVNGKTKDALPVDSTFGPDEYGKLLEDTNATGDLMLNFATTKALDAANFVSYMTGTPGVNPDGGTDWAKTRADNGHQAPYPISFAEVGNEYNLSYEQYWIDGSVVSYANPDCASINKVACLYAFGGTTAFTGQNLVKYDRWQAVNDTDPKPWVSDGTPDQSFYIRYAPVDPTATTIYVNGVAWQRKDSLSGEGKPTPTLSIPRTAR